MTFSIPIIKNSSQSMMFHYSTKTDDCIGCFRWTLHFHFHQKIVVIYLNICSRSTRRQYLLFNITHHGLSYWTVRKYYKRINLGLRLANKLTKSRISISDARKRSSEAPIEIILIESNILKEQTKQKQARNIVNEDCIGLDGERFILWKRSY